MSIANTLVFTLVIAAVSLAVLETEPTIALGHEAFFHHFEDFFGVVFSIEYLARVWCAPENPRYAGPWIGRLKYVFSPASLVDLAAIAVSFFTPTGLKPFALRTFRLIRILRLAKLGRLSLAMGYLIDAIKARRYELLFSFFVGMFFLVTSAAALYVIEGPVQPAQFGSIPRAMWWATATLTTIGYGDVYPITALGKVVAAISAIAGIGLVAMPTGIMAAAFSEAVQRHAEQEEAAAAESAL